MKIFLTVVGLLFALASIAYVTLIFFPGLLFSYKATLNGITIQSDESFEEKDALQILTIAEQKLRKSPFYDPKHAFTVSICNSVWRRRIYFIVQPQAGGLQYYFANTVFLSGAQINENRLISPSGQVVMDDRTLDYFVVHEVTHAMVENAIGSFHYHHLADWIKEGYADYIGRGSALADDEHVTAYLEDKPEMNVPKQAPYLRFNLLVAYYLEREGWEPSRLHKEKLSREEAEQAAQIGLRTGRNI